MKIWFQDGETHAFHWIGQKNKITRRWAKRVTRPSAPHDQRTRSAYIFGAICPRESKGAGRRARLVAAPRQRPWRGAAPGPPTGDLGAKDTGRKELIAITDGYRESERSWLEVLLDLKWRGLEMGPELAVGDGALGFWKALRQVYGIAREQRCWVD